MLTKCIKKKEPTTVKTKAVGQKPSTRVLIVIKDSKLPMQFTYDCSVRMTVYILTTVIECLTDDIIANLKFGCHHSFIMYRIITCWG